MADQCRSERARGRAACRGWRVSAGPASAASATPRRPSACDSGRRQPAQRQRLQRDARTPASTRSGAARPHSISVGSAPPNSSRPSSRTLMRQSSRPVRRVARRRDRRPGSRPAARSAARWASSALLRATTCSKRGPLAQVAAASRPNQRARAGRRRGGVDGDDLADRPAGTPRCRCDSSRLCVPINGACRPGRA